jgi:FSR family fosmidomycin resistance protein-like MFS transporter
VWFSLAALLAVAVLLGVSRWYHARASHLVRTRKGVPADTGTLPGAKVATAIVILLLLIFSKNFYTASLSNYYTFYLIDRFHLSVQQSQIYLFLYLGSIAVGSMIGGPLGDRFGRKYIIWFSVLGALPFALALPFANLVGTGLLTVMIGMIMASSLPAIIVYAQELVPARIGMISGLFYGFAFGMGGLGAAVFGELADMTSIDHVYSLCSYLPAIGIVAALLPDLRKSMA